jgi:hypothetical protein
MLAYFLLFHLSRVLGHLSLAELAHVMVAQPPLHKSAARSALALVRGIQAQVQPKEAAVEVHDIIPMSQSPAHHWRLDVPTHTV